MAQDFRSFLNNSPYEIREFIFNNTYDSSLKYLTLLGINGEKNEELVYNLASLLAKIASKFFEINSLYTLNYIVSGVLSNYLNKDQLKELSKYIWEDFIPAANKVWQQLEKEGEEIPTEPGKIARLEEAIALQMQRQEEIKSEETKKVESENLSTTETTAQQEEAKTTETSPATTTFEEIKIPVIEEKIQEESKENQPEENQLLQVDAQKIPIIEVNEIPTISWEEPLQQQKEIPAESKIIIEETEKKEEEKSEDKPIDVSSF